MVGLWPSAAGNQPQARKKKRKKKKIYLLFLIFVSRIKKQIFLLLDFVPIWGFSWNRKKFRVDLGLDLKVFSEIKKI